MIKINNSYIDLLQQYSLTQNTNAVNKSMQRLSTGVKVNCAKDDPAGLSVINKLNSSLQATNIAYENTCLASNFLNIANGALDNVSSNLMRMNSCAVQACNSTLSGMGRMMLQAEVEALADEIQHLIDSATFNGVKTLINTGEYVIHENGGNRGGGSGGSGGITSSIDQLDQPSPTTPTVPDGSENDVDYPSYDSNKFTSSVTHKTITQLEVLVY